MKQTLVVLLILLTVASTLRELSIYVSFKAHQEEIAFTVCKSRDIPNNTCKGACYLEKQLHKMHSHEQAPSGDVLKSPKQKDTNLYREVYEESHNSFVIINSDYKRYISGSSCAGYINPLIEPPEVS